MDTCCQAAGVPSPGVELARRREQPIKGQREGLSIEERRELCRRNRLLEMGNEILKRASAYFVRENVLPNGVPGGPRAIHVGLLRSGYDDWRDRAADGISVVVARRLLQVSSPRLGRSRTASSSGPSPPTPPRTAPTAPAGCASGPGQAHGAGRGAHDRPGGRGRRADRRRRRPWRGRMRRRSSPQERRGLRYGVLSLRRGSNVPFLVELRGFEPLTPSMRTRCATGLRHSPRAPEAITRR